MDWIRHLFTPLDYLPGFHVTTNIPPAGTSNITFTASKLHTSPASKFLKAAMCKLLTTLEAARIIGHSIYSRLGFGSGLSTLFGEFCVVSFFHMLLCFWFVEILDLRPWILVACPRRCPLGFHIGLLASGFAKHSCFTLDQTPGPLVDLVPQLLHLASISFSRGCRLKLPLLAYWSCRKAACAYVLVGLLRACQYGCREPSARRPGRHVTSGLVCRPWRRLVPTVFLSWRKHRLRHYTRTFWYV